jgi:hypothetical protein
MSTRPVGKVRIVETVVKPISCTIHPRLMAYWDSGVIPSYSWWIADPGAGLVRLGAALEQNL